MTVHIELSGARLRSDGRQWRVEPRRDTRDGSVRWGRPRWHGQLRHALTTLMEAQLLNVEAASVEELLGEVRTAERVIVRTLTLTECEQGEA